LGGQEGERTGSFCSVIGPVMTGSKGHSHFLVRHWLGELSLARSYWINIVAVNLILRLVAMLIYAHAELVPLAIEPIFVIAVWSLFPVIVTWQVVGVARSASRYAQERNTTLYPALASIAVVALAGISLYSFLRSGVPQLMDSVESIRGDPQWSDPLITVLPKATEAEFSGIIKAKSASRLELFLIGHPALKYLHLDTGGGREREAIEMAAAIRKHGLSTYVGLKCESSGIVVFLAGRERVLRNNARIGLHAWRSIGYRGTEINELQAKILMDAGANTAFAEHAMNTPSNSMWYPSPEELVNQGLATRVTDGTGFSLDSSEIAKYTVTGLRAELIRDPEMNALSLREPASFDLSVTHAANLIASGSDTNSSLTALRELLAATVQNAYVCASDEALDACLDLNLEVLKRNMYQAPKDTLLVISLRASASTVPDFPQQANSRYIVALLSSPLVPSVQLNDDSARADAKQLFLKFAEPRDIETISSSIPDDRFEQIRLCELVNDYLAAVKALPAGRRHSIVRILFGLGPKLAPHGGLG
jgi:hypothetical protein